MAHLGGKLDAGPIIPQVELERHRWDLLLIRICAISVRYAHFSLKFVDFAAEAHQDPHVVK